MNLFAVDLCNLGRSDDGVPAANLRSALGSKIEVFCTELLEPFHEAGDESRFLLDSFRHQVDRGRHRLNAAKLFLGCFSFAKPISGWLGESGMGVITRIMGVVLSAIAMGMLADGLKALLPGLAA